MDKKEFEQELINKANEIDIKLNEEQINKFYIYMNLLLEWNEKINLTAITDYKDIILKHFVDSLTISKYIEEDKSIIDVGTGAGFPGVPLKIIREDIKVTLLDSLNKRINFLNEVIEKLELENINTVHARVEEFARNKEYRESFDIATSRAVANLTTLSEYLLPLVKQGGIAICMKGTEINNEVDDSKNAIKILGGKIKTINCFDLANTENKRSIIIISKIKNTPIKYPRKPGTPAKEPLK